MEYKIIDLVFPILVHFLALQLTGILGIGDAAFQTMLAAVTQCHCSSGSTGKIRTCGEKKKER